jgi:amino acid adenylation domain-containing protein
MVNATCSIEPFGLVPPDVRARLEEHFEDAFPVSGSQEMLFLHSRYSSRYEINLFSVAVAGPLDEGAMRGALDRLAHRHTMLRVSFTDVWSSEVLQAVHRTVTLPLDVVDLRHLDAARQRSSITEWARMERGRRFDWAVAPLARVTIHACSPSSFELTLSHANFDARSAGVLVAELLREYGATMRRRSSPLGGEPGTPYRQLVALEGAARGSREHREFWRTNLTDAEPASFTRGTPRRKAGTAAIRRSVEVPSAVVAALHGLARAAHLPLQSFLLAAHCRVVALLSGMDDVVLNLIADTRLEGAAGEGAVGLFANPIPLRVRPGRASWVELAKAVCQTERASWPFRRFPFAELRAAAPAVSHEAGFNYLDLDTVAPVAENGIEVVGRTPPFDLTYLPYCATFVHDPWLSTLTLQLESDGAWLDRRETDDALEYYVAALEAAAEAPNRVAADVVLLSQAQLDAQRRWGAPSMETAPAIPVHRLIEATVERRPDASALVAGAEVMSYRELNARANRLARAICRAGVPPGHAIGIVDDRSVWSVTAVLASLKAGRPFVPLSPTWPSERVERICHECGLTAIVSGPSSAWPWSLEGIAGNVADSPDARRRACGNLAGEVPCGAVAYIMFTSGSAGTPKGVEVTHGGLSNIVTAAASEIGLSSDDCWLSVSALSFDISLLELLAPLTVGGRVVLASADEVRDSRALALAIDRSVATVVQATPSMWRLVLAGGWRGSPSVRLLCGGEPMRRALADELLLRARAVWNVYGPTETTIWSTVGRVVPGTDDPFIGRAFANTWLHVSDPAGQAVPPGSPGELFIGGQGVARGYCRRPAETASRYVPDVNGQPGARMYRTGDRVSWTVDGKLQYLGRLDTQVKLRGFRIELGEIEGVLRRDREVRDAVVSLRAGPNGDMRLVAHVLLAPDSAATAADLRRTAARELPPYMVPAVVNFVTSWPMTGNGKIDRAALDSSPVSVGQRRPHVADVYGPLERQLADVWNRLLQTNTIGRHDNVFDRGAHSLLVMRACVRIERECGRPVTPLAILQHPTVEQLARALQIPVDAAGTV